MKIDYLSDLHLDFYFSSKVEIKDKNIEKLFDPIITKDDRSICEVLIVAGDIGHYNNQNIKVLKYLKEHYYKYIICVLGNHDYYIVSNNMKSKFKNSFERVEDMRKLINVEKNMYCLDGNIIQIEGITFGGCDSWYNDGYYKRNITQILPVNPINKMWNEYMNDANYIYGIKKYDDIWEIEKPKIEATYEKCDVMITHINPSCKNKHINIRFQNNPSNTFLSFEGEEYRVNGNMKYWIFGHTHEELEYEEHGVNCLCNPFGYPGENGNGQWVEIKSFEV